MTFTTDQKLVVIREGVDNTFNVALANPATSMDPLLELADFEPVKRLKKTYNLELLWPAFRKFKGARRFKNATEISFTIDNEPYESSYAFDKDQADDNDLVAKLKGLTPKWAKAYLSLKASLIANLLNNGENLICWDNQGFFDTDHATLDNPTGAGGSQRNYWASGMALTKANLATVDQTMRSRKVQSDSDDVLEINPRVLLVPLALEQTALDIVGTEWVEVSGVKVRNSMFNKYVVKVSARLTDANAWFLIDPDFSKPIFGQERRGVTVAERLDDKDSNVFYQRQYEVGADCRLGVGFGPWQGIAKARA